MKRAFWFDLPGLRAGPMTGERPFMLLAQAKDLPRKALDNKNIENI